MAKRTYHKSNVYNCRGANSNSQQVYEAPLSSGSHVLRVKSCHFSYFFYFPHNCYKILFYFSSENIFLNCQLFKSTPCKHRFFRGVTQRRLSLSSLRAQCCFYSACLERQTKQPKYKDKRSRREQHWETQPQPWGSTLILKTTPSWEMPVFSCFLTKGMKSFKCKLNPVYSKTWGL